METDAGNGRATAERQSGQQGPGKLFLKTKKRMLNQADILYIESRAKKKYRDFVKVYRHYLQSGGVSSV